ncbi:MAG: imidazolonepropionase [Alphaproteobacteria bacterium]|nr:imidazolonepropionase [Alphaproteobacteria bacterium]
MIKENYQLWLCKKIATANPKLKSPFGLINQGAIVTYQNTIEWVGSIDTLPLFYQDKIETTHSLNDFLITPAFIDCHTHLVYAGDRSEEFNLRLQGYDYKKIADMGGGIMSTVYQTRQAADKDLLRLSHQRINSLIQQGVTIIEIKSGYGLDYETEIKILKIIQSLNEISSCNLVPTFLGAHTVPPEYAGKADLYIDFIIEEVLPMLIKKKLTNIVDGFCEKIAFSFQQIDKLFTAAKKLGFAIKLHADQLSDSQGALLAAKHFALSADHLEYSTEKGLKAMAISKTVAVLLPAAFYYLNEKQKPPLNLIRQFKIPMAIATDSNPGTAPTTSLLLMMNMACILFGLTPEEAFAGVTLYAAQALGLNKKYGSIEPGKHADFALWNIETPNQLCYEIGTNPCVGTVKNARFIYKTF